MIEGNVGIKCKLIIIGFKDKFQHLDIYASATSRSGQRLVNALSVQHADFVLFSFDVSQVFAKGMTSEELSVLSGQDIRRVEFDVFREDIRCLRELFDFKVFEPVEETLAMYEFIYWLTDVPRPWRKPLHQVFTQWVSCRQLYAGSEFYCVHKNDARCFENVTRRAVAHNEEQQETGNYRKVKPQAFDTDNLLCLFSVHVDDIKGTVAQETAHSLLAHFNKCVGQCEAVYNSFVHTHIQHESFSDNVFTHQHVYIDSVTPIDVGVFIGKEEEVFVVAPSYMTHTSLFFELWHGQCLFGPS